MIAPTPTPLYHCEPFHPRENGFVHLWAFHDVEHPPKELADRDLLHEHRHANGLADHTHDEPAEVRHG
jgi:hypothetical protein